MRKETEEKIVKSSTMRVRLTLIDAILGTMPSDKTLHETYIASKAPDAKSREEEIAAIGVDNAVQQKRTVFARDEDGNPILWAYQIKGFFKSACQALRGLPGTKSSKLKAYKKQIDLRIFVFPDVNNKASRAIRINSADEVGNLQRPLRAQTMQGERVSIADSEMILAGSTLEFDIHMMDSADEAMVCEWLDYGELNGLGQWRNSGKGAFTWERIG